LYNDFTTGFINIINEKRSENMTEELITSSQELKKTVEKELQKVNAQLNQLAKEKRDLEALIAKNIEIQQKLKEGIQDTILLLQQTKPLQQQPATKRTLKLTERIRNWFTKLRFTFTQKKTGSNG
jgi:hypothetical protein